MKSWLRLWDTNSSETWLIASGVSLGVLLVLYLLRPVFVNRIQKIASRTTYYWDDVLAAMVSATHGLAILAIALYSGTRFLKLSKATEAAFDRILIVVLMAQIGLWATRGIRTWLKKSSERNLKEGRSEAATHLGIVSFLLTVVVWALVVLVTLNNLGFDITALVASLGIGGVAVALAVQNILGDLFASLSITLDRPFLVGDFIVVGDLSGTVKHVGLKTTRVQSLSGEELIFANSDLLQSRIRNYKRMQERRIVFAFGVCYDTPAESLEKLPTLVKEIITAQSEARFDRTHFKSFGASSLDFEVVYYVMNADYAVYMDIQQKINMEMVRQFAQMKVEFAFPTQTLHLASVPAERQLTLH